MLIATTFFVTVIFELKHPINSRFSSLVPSLLETLIFDQLPHAVIVGGVYVLIFFFGGHIFMVIVKELALLTPFTPQLNFTDFPYHFPCVLYLG